jgi:hypothetical protein
MYYEFMKLRKGQAALIVTLVVIVGLTVAVAVISRSVTDVGVSTQEEERARSFSAAEAGVEDALRQDLSAIAGGNFAVGGPETTTDYTVTKLTNVTSRLDPGQVLTIDWSKGTGTSAAVSWDDCADLVLSEITAAGTVTFNVDSGTGRNIAKGSSKLVRLRFVGCSTNVTVAGNGPLSFYDVDSTGVSGQSTSRVKVTRSEPAAPGLMDFAVFSGSDIQ